MSALLGKHTSGSWSKHKHLPLEVPGSPKTTPHTSETAWSARLGRLSTNSQKKKKIQEKITFGPAPSIIYPNLNSKMHACGLAAEVIAWLPVL